MKLYNLYEDIIFEAVKKAKHPLITNPSVDDAIKAIEDKCFVNIEYEDYPNAPTSSKRYVQVYNVGKTLAGNLAVRAYQLGGKSKTTPTQGGWKLFRFDRMKSWEQTNMKFHEPMPKFNSEGDDLMLRPLDGLAKFGPKKDSNYVRKSEDLTQDMINTMSPEDRAKHDAAKKRSMDKFKITPKTSNPKNVPIEPEKPVDTSKTTASGPVKQSAYIKPATPEINNDTDNKIEDNDDTTTSRPK